MRRSLLAAIAAAMLIAPTALAFDSSVVLDQSDPHYGDSITFTETYPQEAAKQSRQPQYPDNPTTAIYCYQDGVQVYLGITIVVDKTKIKGGWIGHTRPIGLTAYWPVNGVRWLGGAASCTAILYNYDAQNVLHIWATRTFEVAP